MYGIIFQIYIPRGSSIIQSSGAIGIPFPYITHTHVVTYVPKFVHPSSLTTPSTVFSSARKPSYFLLPSDTA